MSRSTNSKAATRKHGSIDFMVEIRRIVTDDLEKQDKQIQELDSKLESHIDQQHKRLAKIKDESTNDSQRFDELWI